MVMSDDWDCGWSDDREKSTWAEVELRKLMLNKWTHFLIHDMHISSTYLEAQKRPSLHILFTILTHLFQQFSSWWPNEHEISCWILSRDVWIYDSVLTSSMPSSRKSEEGKLFANGGVLNTIIISEPVIFYLVSLQFTNSVLYI